VSNFPHEQTLFEDDAIAKLSNAGQVRRSFKFSCGFADVDLRLRYSDFKVCNRKLTSISSCLLIFYQTLNHYFKISYLFLNHYFEIYLSLSTMFYLAILLCITRTQQNVDKLSARYLRLLNSSNFWAMLQ